MTENEIYSPNDFREKFEHHLFDYLNENGVDVTSTIDAFGRHSEIKIAQGLNISLMSTVEQVADHYLFTNNILTKQDLGTECDSEYEFKNTDDNVILSSKIKLNYHNLNLQVNCDLNLNNYMDDIEIHALVNDVIKRIDEKIH